MIAVGRYRAALAVEDAHYGPWAARFPSLRRACRSSINRIGRGALQAGQYPTPPSIRQRWPIRMGRSPRCWIRGYPGHARAAWRLAVEVGLVRHVCVVIYTATLGDYCCKIGALDCDIEVFLHRRQIYEALLPLFGDPTSKRSYFCHGEIVLWLPGIQMKPPMPLMKIMNFFPHP